MNPATILGPATEHGARVMGNAILLRPLRTIPPAAATSSIAAFRQTPIAITPDSERRWLIEQPRERWREFKKARAFARSLGLKSYRLSVDALRTLTE